MRGLSLTEFRASKHPADVYCREVISGKRVTGRLVRLACERHVRDLERGAARGLYFDPLAGQLWLDFFSLCKHSKGEWAGQPVVLEPWQQFIFYVLFGWKRADGTRRFRIAHVEVARKNGKSTMVAGIGLGLLVIDGEPGAEVYAAATKKDQAKIVFDEAVKMRKASPSLTKRIAAFRDNLSVAKTNSKFVPLGSDEDTLDGLNISGAIIDELHAHKTRALYDVIETAMGARRQPLLFEITTAGFNKLTICWSQREYGEKILEQIIDEASGDNFFCYVATLDDKDDWEDEKNWIKANPNLGVSVKLDNLRELAAKAKDDPTALNSFLRLRLNQWTQSETRAINPDKWKACVGVPLAGTDALAVRRRALESLRGRRMFAGLDLSSKLDLTCYMRVFPPTDDDERWILLPDFWVPDDNIADRVKTARVPYDVWKREGFLYTTDGNVIDYDVIEAKIIADRDKYEMIEVAFDPWNATQTSVHLIEAFGENPDDTKVVEFRQGFGSMSEPTKEFLALIQKGTIAHFANPILNWMSSNLVTETDSAGNIKPSKNKSSEKIDGMVAAIMAIGRAISNPTDDGSSVYDEQGITML